MDSESDFLDVKNSKSIQACLMYKSLICALVLHWYLIALPQFVSCTMIIKYVSSLAMTAKTHTLKTNAC